MHRNINVQNKFGLVVQYMALQVLRGSYLKQAILVEGVEIGKGHSGAHKAPNSTAYQFP